ncbi:hypothetical protein F5Y19DRAFT_268233 [Xylariaceae sp. FL1651]|nr:hypothetical protein F5Y19DRAFT_268233 [Xylariaceae sp. FL1651]
MVAIRLSSSLNALRATRTRALQGQQRTFIATSRFRAHQGYGDGKGDPVAENPQKQPEATKAQESSEHPGPAPPDVGKGSANAPTKRALSDSMEELSGEKSPEEASAQSGGSRSKEAIETGESPTGGEIPNSGNGTEKGGEALKGPQGDGAPQPKIHNQSVPGVKSGLTDEQKREVEKHNEEFEKKHDKAEPAQPDKVNKKFWSGTGGRNGGEAD